MVLMYLLVLTLSFFQSSFSETPSKAALYNPKWVTKLSECRSAGDGARVVYLLKQWHLEPSANTHDPKKTYPQAENQYQIYEQLLDWQNNKQIDTLVAEGCEGAPMGSGFKPVFNGWSRTELESHASTDANYDQILTHSILKLEAKVKTGVHALCGDNLESIKKSQLALSDARGDLGYLSRLSELKDQPEQAKTYLDGTIEALKLKSDSSIQDAIAALRKDLKNSLARFNEATHARNLSFIKTIKASKSVKPVVLVIGGLHTADLKALLEENKLNCVVFEPLAYKNDEDALVQSLKKLVTGL